MTTTDTWTSQRHPTCRPWCRSGHADPLDQCETGAHPLGLAVMFIPADNSTTGQDAYLMFVPGIDGSDGDLVGLNAHQAARLARALEVPA